MKKYLKLSLIYSIAAMVCGVFYREFTKANGFEGATTLGKAHGHLFMLGMVLFLLTALFAARLQLDEQKTFRVFMKIYNIGLPLTVIMMIVRGILQVRGTELSAGANASIAGVAGIGHIMLGTGIILFLVSLLRTADNT